MVAVFCFYKSCNFDQWNKTWMSWAKKTNVTIYISKWHARIYGCRYDFEDTIGLKLSWLCMTICSNDGDKRIHRCVLWLFLIKTAMVPADGLTRAGIVFDINLLKMLFVTMLNFYLKLCVFKDIAINDA